MKISPIKGLIYNLITGLFLIGIISCSSQESETNKSSDQANQEELSMEAQKGETLVKINCSPCHGLEGEGKIGIAPSIRNRDFLALASDQLIRTTIKKGRAGTGMVPRADLSDEQISSIIAYLRALPIAIPTKMRADDNLTFSGNLAEGEKTYRNFCSQCHGAKGEGYAAGGSGPGIGLASFLEVASDDFIFKTVKYGRVGTPMKSFIGQEGVANLSEQDIHNVIAYLRSQISS